MDSCVSVQRYTLAWRKIGIEGLLSTVLKLQKLGTRGTFRGVFIQRSTLTIAEENNRIFALHSQRVTVTYSRYGIHELLKIINPDHGGNAQPWPWRKCSNLAMEEMINPGHGGNGQP